MSEFYRQKSGRHGTKAECKACSILRTQGWQAEHPEEVKANKKKDYYRDPKASHRSVTEFYKENPVLKKFYALKKNAKTKGKVFLLERHEYVSLWETALACPICDRDFGPRSHTPARDNRSFDRIQPDGPYSTDNCWVICGRCNAIKQDAIPSEIRALADKVEEEMVKRGINPQSHSRLARRG